MKWGFVAVCFIAFFFRPGVGRAATDDSAAVVPFLDQTTVAVARIDVAAINIDAIGLWIENSLKSTGQSPESIADVAAWLKSDDCENLKKAQADLLAAGGKTVFMVVDFDNEPMPFFVVPMAAGANVEELKTAITELLKLQNGDPKSVEMVEVNKSLRVAHVGLAQQLANLKAVPRAGIISLLNSSDAPIRIALSTSDLTRQKILAFAPNLPRAIGSASTTVLTDGMRTVTISVTVPPAVSLRIGIGALDADSLKTAIETVRNALSQSADPSARTKLQSPQNLFSQIEAKAVNGRVSILFDNANCSKIVGEFYVTDLGGRAKADIVFDQSNIKAIYQLSQIYAAEHIGIAPNSLVEIVKVASPDLADPMSFGILKNIRDPSRKPGYTYNDPHGLLNKIPHPDSWVLVYDAYDKWPVIHGVSGINAGFADGHVEFIADEAKFKTQLAESKPLSQ
jgi:prepilin-type processing-associated H-X9-DG protein